MTLILNIETATTNCSVALAENGKTIALKEDNEKSYSHSERLHVYIQKVLDKSKTKLNDLDAIAISKGPGSYTGLRIGVSAAKGLCYSLNIPLISVLTLKSLALKVNIRKGFIVPLLDARRMEVYSAIFDHNFKMIRDTKAEIVNEQSFKEQLYTDDVHFIGSGVEKIKSIIKHKNAHFIEGELPSASKMDSLSFEKYTNNDLENVAYFEPYYLKDFVAVKRKT